MTQHDQLSHAKDVLATSFETLSCQLAAPHVLLVSLNRPAVGNAINTQMGRDLLRLWTMLTEDAQDIRCIVLAGTGNRIFCAGGDLKERNGMSRETWQKQHELFERQYWTLTDLPIPVIAAVNGHAYAGGLETVLACDFAYGSEDARFALTEVSIGIMPGAGGTQNLPRAIGERRAKEVILTARPFDAQQALAWGVLNAVFPADKVISQALQTAQRIAENAPLSVKQAKKSIRYGMQMELRTAFRFEVEAYNHLVDTEDRLEGVAAFNEKRKPHFKGR
ncbi:MAG: hypothetical protein RIQ49_146 [Pseudomonadota bacterium]|jgi:enoyl-CoA hydratase/carnithine racemase